MARREQAPSQDKDVEASQAELAVLDGEKSKTHDEVLVVINDKKRLEKERDELVSKIDKEVTQKRKAADEEIALLDKAVIAARERKSQAERDLMASVSGNVKKDLAQAITDRDAAVKERDIEQAKLAEVRTARTTEEAEVTRLQGLKQNLSDGIADARSDLKNLEGEKKKLEDDLPAKRAEFEQTKKDHVAETSRGGALLTTNNKLHQQNVAKNAELDGVLKQINERNGALIELTNKITEVEKELADKKEEVKKLDADSAERAGNAARLEQHVDEKLAHLKELESHFTTERLAKYGYKKTE